MKIIPDKKLSNNLIQLTNKAYKKSVKLLIKVSKKAKNQLFINENWNFNN